MGADLDLVLAAVDGSDEAVAAAEYAVAVATQYGADLHVLHILDDRLMRGVDHGDLSTEAVAASQQEVTDAVRETLPETVTLRESGAVGFSEDRLGQTPGSVIVETADQLGADFLVVPCVSASTAGDAVLGKAALHVLEYAPQPVLSV